jgi:hypothetical protein
MTLRNRATRRDPSGSPRPCSNAGCGATTNERGRLLTIIESGELDAERAGRSSGARSGPAVCEPPWIRGYGEAKAKQCNRAFARSSTIIG